jgi:hypothetical protein
VKAAGVVGLVWALAGDAAADPREVKRVFRVDIGGSYFEAKGEDPEVADLEERELSYKGPVGAFTISGGQLLAPFLAVHGMAFAEVGAPECVQRDRVTSFPRTYACMGESWPLASGIGAGVTFEAPGGSLYSSFGGWGGILRLEDPMDEDPSLVPWYGFDVAVGAGWRADRHWRLGFALRARFGFSSDDDDFRSFTSLSIAMSFARR